MSGIKVPDKVLVFQYKGHKFYMDVRKGDDVPLVHITPKGKEVDSNVWDEQEAVEAVDTQEW